MKSMFTELLKTAPCKDVHFSTLLKRALIIENIWEKTPVQLSVMLDT